MTTMLQEHGQVVTWDVLIDCGYVHGHHASTESTQGHNIM
jgi:hypothetical protein